VMRITVCIGKEMSDFIEYNAILLLKKLVFVCVVCVCVCVCVFWNGDVAVTTPEPGLAIGWCREAPKQLVEMKNCKI